MELSERRRLLLGRLRSSRLRPGEGLVLVEGVRAVGEALQAGAEARFAVVSARLEERDRGAALLRTLEATDTQIVRSDDRSLDDLVDTERHQGVLIVCREPRGDPDAIAPSGGVLVADGIQDPGNLGTLIRSAVAFGTAGVVVLKGTVDPWAPKSVRSSAGMGFRLPVVRMSGPRFLAWTDETDRAVLVAEPGGVDVRRLSPGHAWVLVVGNEGRGVSPEVRRAATARPSVSMVGPADSLNAGVAGAILLYALTREASLG